MTTAIDTLRVLVIEDSPVDQLIAEALVEHEGWLVASASTGQAGLELLAEFVPDLVLLDMILPDVSGIVLCARIKEFVDVPVVMVTGSSAPADRYAAFESGADDFVAKPYLPRELLFRIRSVAGRSEEFLVSDSVRSAPVPDREQLVLDALSSGQIITFEALHEAVWGLEIVENTPRLRQLVAAVRARHGVTIVSVRSVGYRLAV